MSPEERRTFERERKRKYRATAKGRAVSEAARKKYEASDKGRAMRKAGEQRAEVKAYRKSYWRSKSAKAIKQARRNTPEGKAIEAGYRQAYQADPANRPKIRARYAIADAIRRGRMKRQPCQVCGAPETHAHHHDYARKRDVIWLCPRHHGEIHAG
jgi:hypothetical protein